MKVALPHSSGKAVQPFWKSTWKQASQCSSASVGCSQDCFAPSSEFLAFHADQSPPSTRLTTPTRIAPSIATLMKKEIELKGCAMTPSGKLEPSCSE